MQAIKSGSEQESLDALNKLCECYWPPLYAFIRSRNFTTHDAQDLTQAFFANLLSNETLKNAEQTRGRFRNFLLTCLNHFLINQWKRGQTEKRGRNVSFISWEEFNEETLTNLPPFHQASPNQVYDRFWACSLVNRVLEVQEKEYQKLGKIEQFELLRKFLPGGPGEISHMDAAAALKISRPALDVALHRFKQRFGFLLRREVSETVASPEEIDGEIEYLLSAWS